MDLETENRIAAILMKEAEELRRQAQSEGSLAFLRQPAVRFRPNSRFLTATVRGVQQANRVVEVNEMWRLREKQLELDNRLKGSRNESSTRRSYKDEYDTSRSSSCNELETSRNVSPSSKKRDVSNRNLIEDEGLRDDEVDEFLHSRTKRGRGAVGSRTDETGPYLPSCPDSKTNLLESIEEKEKARVLLGPEKPYYLKSRESSLSDDDEETRRDKKRKAKRRSSSKQRSKKHRLEEKSRDKKKDKRKETKSKYCR